MSNKNKCTKRKVTLGVEIHEGAMFLRSSVASGTDDNGKPFDVCLINMHTPAVEYEGRMFIFSLQELVGAVVEQASKPAAPAGGG